MGDARSLDAANQQRATHPRPQVGGGEVGMRNAAGPGAARILLLGLTVTAIAGNKLIRVLFPTGIACFPFPGIAHWDYYLAYFPDVLPPSIFR